MLRVVIVGGGASGTLTAVAIAASSAADVTVVERSGRVGPGQAYGAADPHHLLNSPAGRMGAFEGDPGHFVAWCAARGVPVDPGDFVPRRRYGAYLSAVLDPFVANGRVRIVRGEAVAVEAVPAPRVRLADGRTLLADRIVLALGNPPPAGRGLDPWAPGALDAVAGRRVLLIGTGLTMVDVATAIARRSPGTRLTATSRTLRLPLVHLGRPLPAGPGIRAAGPSLAEVLRAFRDRLRIARAEGRPWQPEVDGVRPQVNGLWAGFSPMDRAQYVRHVSRAWEVHRHRMAPSVAAEIDALRAQRTLTIEPVIAGGAFDAIVDCTGPRAAGTRGWSALVDDLLARGCVRADPLGLGIAVDAVGAALDAHGRPSAVLTVIGPARRGSEWECTAVPEIRAQAAAFASILTA